MNDKILRQSLSVFTQYPTWDDDVNILEIRGNIVQRCCAIFYRKRYPVYQQAQTSKVKYLKDNISRVIVLLLYISVNIALTLYVTIYRAVVLKSAVFPVLARISGMLLNFNCSLIVVLMLRRTVLLIRSTVLYKFLPIDNHISFHKFVGRLIGVLSIFHMIAHAINFAMLKGEFNLTKTLIYSFDLYSVVIRIFLGNIHGNVASKVRFFFMLYRSYIVHQSTRNRLDRRICATEWHYFVCHTFSDDRFFYALGAK